MQVVKVNEKTTADFPFEWTQQIRLEGKVVLCFGGGGNLAETFEYALASSGAIPVISDFLPEDATQAQAVGGKITRILNNVASLNPNAPDHWFSGDITSVSDVNEIVERVVRDFGRLDIVVDFAGISHQPFDLFKDDLQDMVATFRRVNNINLNGAFIVTACAARAMIPQRFGQIIHLCSSGSRCSLYGVYAYNATKHAVEGLIKTAAAQLAPFGIRVNGIAPGTVETNLNRDLLRKGDGNFKPRANSILAHTPSKRFATREGVAETLMALCLEQRHLTGNVVFPDDGYVVEGHSWPEGNEALYAGADALDALFRQLDVDYPRNSG